MACACDKLCRRIANCADNFAGAVNFNEWIDRDRFHNRVNEDMYV